MNEDLKNGITPEEQENKKSGDPDFIAVPEDPVAPAKPMRFRNIIIWSVILIALIAVSISLMTHEDDISFGDVTEALRNLNVGFALLGAAFLLFSIFAEGRAIASSGRAIGVNVNCGKSTLFACVEMFFAGITPSASGGQPAVVYFMYKDGIKISRSTAMLLTNTLHYTVSMLILSVFATVYRHDFLVEIFAKNSDFRILYILGFVANCLGMLSCLLFIFAPGIVRFFAVPLFRLLAKLRIVRDLDARLKSFDVSLGEYRECHKLIRNSPLTQLKTLVWNLLQKSGSCMIGYCIYRALGYDQYGFLNIICFQMMILLTVNALPLPGSGGASEWMTKELYMLVYCLNVKHPSLATIFSRAMSFYVLILICGTATAAFYIYLYRRDRRTLNAGGSP
ncbi:MAG: flippase-like domain-containing protein [Clostridia bacterium]|nr:flippase-like domain-containing protein [Clostridia bacterium]